MPLWYHPPPVLVEEGAPAAPGCPVNPPLYYHPPPVCVDASEDAVLPPSGTAPPQGAGVASSHAAAHPSSLLPAGATSSPGGGFINLPPPIMSGIYPAPYQGGMSSYSYGDYGGFHTAGNPSTNMAPQPAGTGTLGAGYSNKPSQGLPPASTSLPTFPGDFPGSPRLDTADTATPCQFKERIYYCDDKSKEIYIADPNTSAKYCTQSEQFCPQLQANIPFSKSGRQSRAYYIDESSGHKISISPTKTSNSPRQQRRSRHLELTREGSGEFEVKLWRGGDHRCEKKVRVVSGPGGEDDIDIKLSECQICDSQDNEQAQLDEFERQRLQELVTKAKMREERARQLEEHKLKEKMRNEEYARMKADEKLKLEIREEIKREDRQRQETVRVQSLQTGQRVKEMEAERRADEDRKREYIRKEIDIELKKRQIELEEEEKKRQLYMEELIREQAKQREYAAEMENRRQANISKIEEENKKKLEDKIKEEARQRELALEAERERIRREIDAELEKREKVRLANIEADKKQKEEEEKIKEEARRFELEAEMERRRLANQAELVAEKNRKAEEQKRAEGEAQERRQKVEEANIRKAEDRIRREEWEKLRTEEMQRMREEIRKEINEAEARRLKDEQIKSEMLRIQQLEADRIRSDEQVRLRVEAGREELRKEIRKELEREEHARIARLQAEAAALKVKTDAENLVKEQARIRAITEAQGRERMKHQIAHEEAFKKQQLEQAEVEMRKHARAQAITLEKERLRQEREGEATRAAGMATAIAEENELRRIIRAEIKEDMRKSHGRGGGELVGTADLNKLGGGGGGRDGVNANVDSSDIFVSPHRERVQLHWEADYGDGFE